MEKEKQRIGMEATPRYEEMIILMQKKYAPITRTAAIRKLMDEGAKVLLKGSKLPNIEERW